MSVHNNIVRAIDDGKVSLMVLLDLSAAFDTVNHDTLIQVLEDPFRVNGAALEWFKYLTDRTQTFQVGSETSGTHHVTCGVPQGSVLGPKEFIAYTEDIACLFETHETEYHLYADDIQTVAHAYPTDIAPAVVRSQQCIEAVRQWCIPNDCSLIQ